MDPAVVHLALQYQCDGSVAEYAKIGGVYVFLDDSGDAGVKFDAGSTQHLVMAACVFREQAQIAPVMDAITGCRDHHRQQREFKYAKTKGSIKDDFFRRISPHPFSVRTIIIDKKTIYSKRLLESPNDLKAYAIRQLLTHTYGTIHNAKIVIDGHDTKSFQMTDHAYFTKQVNGLYPGLIREIEFVDSKQNVLVQLADMVAGAVHRHVRSDEKQDSTHFDTFRRRTFQPSGSFWRYR